MFYVHFTTQYPREIIRVNRAYLWNHEISCIYQVLNNPKLAWIYDER